MIQIKKSEKRLLRKYLKKLNINFYKISNEKQMEWYNSTWFKWLLQEVASTKVKKAIKKEVINPKFIFKLYIVLIVFLWAYAIYFYFLK